MTDANVMLGKIHPEFFPHAFGHAGNEPIDAARVREKFTELASEIASKTGEARSPEEVAEGFVKVAVDNMANAIKKISIERGHDVTAYTLCCFGGAAGQHACQVADALAITRVFIHPYAGVLSAYGMGLAEQVAMREQTVELKLDEATLRSLEAIAERLGVQVIGRHTALGDAILTGEVFLKMIPLLAQQGIRTLREAREAAERTYYARLKY